MMSSVATRGFATTLRERGERYVLGVPCTTTMRDLEAPLPAYQGVDGVPRPLAIGNGVAQITRSDAWRRLTVRDGEKGPVDIEMVKRRVQTRLERKRTGPEEWLVVTRRPLCGRPHVGAPRLSRCHRSGRPLSLSLLPHADRGVRGGAVRSPLLQNWRASSRRAPALKRVSNEARARWAWTSTRCAPGKAGITTWRCR